MTFDAPPYFFVFDVESVGLHGLGFAVGWVVVDLLGNVHESGLAHAPPHPEHGTDEGYKWVQDNVPDLSADDSANIGPLWSMSAAGVRNQFWASWRHAQHHYSGVVMAADVPWPVEARFLAHCIDDVAKSADAMRPRQSPYPIIDVASVRLAVGLDPLQTLPRLPKEEPRHNPLCDARQSARVLIEALAVGNSRHTEPKNG